MLAHSPDRIRGGLCHKECLCLQDETAIAPQKGRFGVKNVGPRVPAREKQPRLRRDGILWRATVSWRRQRGTSGVA